VSVHQVSEASDVKASPRKVGFSLRRSSASDLGKPFVSEADERSKR
jgi:hypothetical protein